ncbi:hypothetical protein Btru_069865 [Bulinus truncatus]|nr:hypothetical protein Btru_069865 [Bulinus truncatus]
MGMSRKRLLIVSTVLICGLAVALTVGLVLHFQLNDDDDGETQSVSRTRSGVLVDCLPELRRDADKMRGRQQECERRGCIWFVLEDTGAPWCTHARNSGYVRSGEANVTNSSYEADLTLSSPAPLAPYLTTVYQSVQVSVDWQTDQRVRVKIFPKNVQRWEIPTSTLDFESSRSVTNKSTSDYSVTFTDDPWGVAIIRRSTGTVVFNSSFPGLILSDQFLQLTTRLPNVNVYGFGEHRHESFKHDMNWRLWSMFTRDSGPNVNLHMNDPM